MEGAAYVGILRYIDVTYQTRESVFHEISKH